MRLWSGPARRPYQWRLSRPNSLLPCSEFWGAGHCGASRRHRAPSGASRCQAARLPDLKRYALHLNATLPDPWLSCLVEVQELKIVVARSAQLRKVVEQRKRPRPLRSRLNTRQQPSIGRYPGHWFPWQHPVHVWTPSLQLLSAAPVDPHVASPRSREWHYERRREVEPPAACVLDRENSSGCLRPSPSPHLDLEYRPRIRPLPRQR